MVSNPNPNSGETITVTWTVTNQGGRTTRTNGWYDGVFLSRDAALDASDYPLVDRGSRVETAMRIRQSSMIGADGKPKFLAPGESYTNSATFTLPTAIGGDFQIIVKADTDTSKDPYSLVPSTIREGLPNTYLHDRSGEGIVREFRDEGNNIGLLALPINHVTPPDLQVTQVTIPESVLSGQKFAISYRVENQGGNTPSDQRNWRDEIYLSRDRFLDLDKDRFLGYADHSGGLAAGGSYDIDLGFNAPRDLDGAYYVFVVTDPARNGGYGKVIEFGNDHNNATAAVQPLLIVTPPPADLVAGEVIVPANAQVGDAVQIQFTVSNQSEHPARGRWTDALYLSSDNQWDIGDVLLGRVERVGDLVGGASYTATLNTKLPALKDGSWRIIVRPDIYNEVYEGPITYTEAGLNVAPGEANNKVASASTINVTVPTLAVASPLQTTLSKGETKLYKVSVTAGETLRVSLDSSAAQGANEVYIRYGEVPSSSSFDAAYSLAMSPDQEAIIPSTLAGDYYVLVRSRESAANTPVTLRADLMPLSITRVTPDHGGSGSETHRWVTFEIEGARFKAGALVKLSRPGAFEIEPARWQVLDATRIRAVFDLANVPHGLYDVVVINPDGQRVTEPYRYLVERAIEADVTIGIGGARNLEPGQGGLYSVSLQSLTNVDTPYVRFDVGATEMGRSGYVLENLALPYVVFASNVGGSPDGAIIGDGANTQTYGPTPTTGNPRADAPWAQLDSVLNTNGWRELCGADLSRSGRVDGV